MIKKKTMTLNLSEKEMSALEDLSRAKNLTKTRVLIQSLRLYQLVSVRMEQGARMYFNTDKDKLEVIVLP